MSGKITDPHIESAIRARVDFITVGAAHAFHPTTRGQYATSLGSLPEAWRKRYSEDVTTHGIDYVVMSYNTPIAWVRRDGVKVVPDVKYSATTTRLQNRARSAFDHEFVG